jgi:hypothetical protein
MDNTKIDYINNIPEELQRLNRWVCWKTEMKINKKTSKEEPTKVLKIPWNGNNAKSNEPKTWGSYETALEGLKKFDFDGIGFVFNGDGLIGIDVDECRDIVTGQFNAVGFDILSTLNSYAEISPSGQGLHIICRGTIKGDKKQVFYEPKKHLGIYDIGRYFTMTGDILDDGHADIEERAAELDFVYEKYINVQKTDKNVNEKPNFVNESTSFVTEADVFDRIEKSKKKDHILGLLNGVYDKIRYPSPSEAEMGLMNELAFLSDRNTVLMWNMFSTAGIFRPDEYKRNPKKYDTTLRKAINDCRECYSERRERVNAEWESRKKKKHKQQEPPEQERGLEYLGDIAEEDFDKRFNLLYADTIYSVQNSCLHYTKKSDDNDGNLVYLANFIVKPEAEVIRDNGQDITRSFKLSAYQFKKQLPELADVEAEKFASLNFIIPTWGMNMRVSTSPNTTTRLRDAIQALSSNIPVNKVFTHTGWREIDKKAIYLHAAGAVGCGSAIVELEGKLANYKLPDKQDTAAYRGAAKMVIEFLKLGPSHIVFSLLSCVSLSILCHFMKKAGCEPSFILFMLGKTGTFKSTVAALTLNFFGSEFNLRNLPGSIAKDTANALEKNGFLLKDSLFVVDDLFPSGDKSDMQKIKANFQALSRGYGDRTGRTRMNYDLTIRKPYIPRGMCLITGEDIPDIGQSGAARNLILKISEGDINVGLLTMLQDDKEKLSIFTRGFIEWLSTQADILPSCLEAKFKQYRSKATATGQHRRMPEIVAFLSTGFDMVMEYMNYIGAIDCLDRASENAYKVFQDICKKQQDEMTSDTPVQRFITAIQELIVSRGIYVKSIAEAPDQWGGDLVGFYDAEFYYMFPGPLYGKIRKFYEDQGNVFPLTKNGLYDALREKGVIHTGKDNEPTPPKKISGKTYRLLWIKKSSLDIEEKNPEQLSFPWERETGLQI